MDPVDVPSAEPNEPSDHLPAEEPQSSSPSAEATQWEQAYAEWQRVDLKGHMASWDESFAQVISNKENHNTERTKLVSYVKEFTVGYKESPSAQRVEELLKFFKRFVASLYERTQLAEKSVIQMHQLCATLPDPAPLLLAAHVELNAKQRSLKAAHTAANEARRQAEDLRVTQQRSAEEAAAQAASVEAATSQYDQQRISSLEAEVITASSRLDAALQQLDASKAESAILRSSAQAAQDSALRASTELESVEATLQAEIAALEAEVLDLTGEAAGLRQSLKVAQSSQKLNSGQEADADGRAEFEATMRDELEQETARRRTAEQEVDSLRVELTAAQKSAQVSEAASSGTAGNPKSAAEVGNAAAVRAAAASKAAAELLAERKKVRQLTFDLENAESRRASEETAYRRRIEALEGQIRELSAMLQRGGGASASGVHLAGNEDGGDAAEGVPRRSSSSAAFTAEDFDALLSGPSKDDTADSSSRLAAQRENASATASTDVTDASADSSSSSAIVLSLQKQREQLRKELHSVNEVTGRLRSDLIAANSRVEAALIENSVLQRRLDGRGVPGGVAIAIGSSGRELGSQGGAAGSSKAKQFRSLVDFIAESLATMLAAGSGMRMFVVVYLFSVHVFIFSILYYTNANYFHHSQIMKVAPKGGHSGHHGLIGQGTA